jgi:CRISPR-associated endonuclease/helicase Cas3
MTAARLTPDDFTRFFRAVHGEHESPFPWQERLAAHVFEKGWPGALDVPTGAGKTAAIDVAVFHLALEATKREKRRAPVRIVFVVDRRLVVDDAHARAIKIATALARATDGVLLRVKQRLAPLAERAELPLMVSKLRGGAPREPEWIRTPAQPAVVVSTVDQVGSRLFFRGYGISDTMKPVHAGLIGADALILLDEAHLSQPFLSSVRDSRAYQLAGPWSEDAAAAPFSIVTLSATQTDVAPALVKGDDRKHEVLGPRLTSPKPVQLVSTGEEPGSKAWVAAFAERAWALSRLGGGTAVTTAVVVNRVARARAIHVAITERLGGSPGGDAALLIGPARPLDRDARLRDLLPRMSARRRAAEGERPLFVVATQCIEAGADLDFDAMVTEAAPLDCLRQRFGRLNRMGRPIDASGVVLASAAEMGGRAKPDVIYGESVGATWSLLSEKAEVRGKGKDKRAWIDFGIEAARAWLPDKEHLSRYLAPRKDAPVMMPAFVEQWANTSPIPLADPEVSFFLHGPRSGPPDVQIVWRADLGESAPELWAERMAACPPSSLEAVSVSIQAARAWLQSRPPVDVVDVESAPSEDEDERSAPPGGRRALRWRGPDHAEFVWPNQIAPGDMLVVPSAYGGCDEWGWAQGAEGEVTDLGAEANRRHRGLEVLRLATEIVAVAWHETGLDRAASWNRAERLQEIIAGLREERDGDVRSALAADEHVPPQWRSTLQKEQPRLERFGALAAVDGSSLAGVPLAFVRRLRPAERGDPSPEGAAGTATTEDDRSSRSSKAVRLGEHSNGVREFARLFAEQLGLASDIAADMALAAFLHDSGKAHPDFKRWLYGGDERAAIAGPELAKSGRRLGPETRGGLAAGARHEVASLAFATAHAAFREARDPDLVLWLVGTHHGHGRPFFPAVEWPAAGSRYVADLGGAAVTSEAAPMLASLTARWCDVQARLTRKYGPWGLARLEALLRLADHRRSEAEEGV